ncbi:hypothetical protein [Aquimarina sediminis]|uniref:hypothetical protein n=1 Tax=Aquimarina sediminis TaxID=2070536 RepID=UPI000CA08065|nr:hypothetical protein [Aquimarina sediminis]
MTDEEFELEALNFFRENAKYYSASYPIDFKSDALNYVKKSRSFKYKDDVEAGVLVTCLVDLGYIEFVKKENNIRYHSLTEKGQGFINKLKFR